MIIDEHLVALGVADQIMIDYVATHCRGLVVDAEWSERAGAMGGYVFRVTDPKRDKTATRIVSARILMVAKSARKKGRMFAVAIAAAARDLQAWAGTLRRIATKPLEAR